MQRAEGRYVPTLKNVAFKQGRESFSRPSPVGDAARTGDARVLATANTSRRESGLTLLQRWFTARLALLRIFFVTNESVGFNPLWARQGRRHFILV